MNLSTGAPVVGRLIPSGLRAHPFAAALTVAVLVGGGLRLVPTSTAAAPGAGGAGAGSTACAAK